MLSVLIPVYNYDVVPLVKELHSQLLRNSVDFEIYCGDDCSSELFINKNMEVNTLKNTRYITADTNIGRVEMRQFLAKKANYDWLLFLDADTLPVTSAFISDYLTFLKSDYDAIFAGIAYEENLPSEEFRLRWTYGTDKEASKASKRNQNPYQSIVSANFMIKKNIFLNVNSRITGKEYGYDVLFGSILKSNSNKIIHVDNQVYHLGLETNEHYLIKKENAAQTAIKLLKSGAIKADDSKLVATFLKLKDYKLNYLMSLFFSVFNSALKKNLLSDHPSSNILQLYRICYMCHIDLKADT